MIQLYKKVESLSYHVGGVRKIAEYAVEKAMKRSLTRHQGLEMLV